MGAADLEERRHRRDRHRRRRTAGKRLPDVGASASIRPTRRSSLPRQRARATDKTQGPRRPSSRWPTTSDGRSATHRKRRPRRETFTAASLEAMRRIRTRPGAAARQPVRGGAEEYERAVDLDPGFARAYSGMAGVYANYFRQPDKAAASYEAAMKHLDRMTEREKYRTLGTYYLDIVRNYEKAIENFETARQVSTRPTTAATATWRWPTLTSADIQERADRSAQEPRDLSEEFAAALQLRDVFDVRRRLRHGDQRGTARAEGKP